MDSHQLKSFSLTVVTSDKSAETIILNNQFQRVESSVEEKSIFYLKEGLYSVKVRAGLQSTEKQIALFKDELVNFDPIPFASPAPLKDTVNIYDYQINESQNHSHKIHRSIGKGSQIYIFIRNKTKNVFSDTSLQSQLHPLQGLTLLDKEGTVIVNLIEFADDNLNNPNQEPWAACNVELDPGIYQLNLKMPVSNYSPQNNLCQTIIASPGWQTQVFMLQSYTGSKERYSHVDLSNSSVFMSRMGIGFSPNSFQNYPEDLDYRLIEMTRQALKNQRNVLAKDVIQKMLIGKFDNPMLGIYVAHLLILDNKIDNAQVQIVINNLRDLLGHSHPDVEAIALKLNMQSDYIFKAFPMLSNSWKYVLEASIEKPDIIASDSLISKYAGQFSNCDLWLIWVRSSENNKKNLFEQIKKYTNLNYYSKSFDLNLDQVMDLPKGMSYGIEADFGNNEQQNTEPQGEKLSKTNFSNEQLLPIVQSLGIPRNKVEELLNDNSLNESYDASLRELQFDEKPENKNEDDPQKGKWGEQPEANFRKMTATVNQSSNPKYYTVIITVESTNESKPLEGVVKFHLHDTFLNPDPMISVIEGKAILKLTGVWGGFTVGAEADNAATKLELDLAKLPDVPQEFKSK